MLLRVPRLAKVQKYLLNPFLTSRLVHPYHLDESICRFKFLMKILTFTVSKLYWLIFLDLTAI